MKYHKFNRRGRYDIFGRTYFKSQKKTMYMLKTGRSKKLDSFFLDNQVWGALHKAWKVTSLPKIKERTRK